MADIAEMANLTMKFETTMGTRIAALTGELEFIYAANHSYWKIEGNHSSAVNAEYDLRQLRLIEIVRELNELRQTAKVKTPHPQP